MMAGRVWHDHGDRHILTARRKIIARLIVIAFFVAVIVAIAAILLSFWTTATAPRNTGPAQATARNKDAQMGPRNVQKMAYVALIVVLFGVTSGWLGGL